MSYFDEADSENREKKERKNRFRESLISRIEEFEGFRENKISRTEASSVFTFREKVQNSRNHEILLSRNFTLLRYIISLAYLNFWLLLKKNYNTIVFPFFRGV